MGQILVPKTQNRPLSAKFGNAQSRSKRPTIGKAAQPAASFTGYGKTTMVASITLWAVLQTASAMPVLPAGNNEVFYRSAYAVVDALAKSDFDGARKLLKSLPKVEIVISWNETKIPESRRAEFRMARDKALTDWQRLFPEFKWSFASKGDIQFDFSPSLPPNADSPMPAGAVHFLSSDPNDPRVESVISMQRGNPPEPADSMDIHAEVGYAVAAYFGLARSPIFGSVSSRTELPHRTYMVVSRYEAFAAKENLQYVDKLAAAVLKRKPLQSVTPAAKLDEKQVNLGEATQGEIKKFSLQIANNGTGPLRWRAVPDCSCLSADNGGQIPAGSAMTIRAQVDTTDFVGELHKQLMIYTNDPEMPIQLIPVTLKVQPLYRFLPAPPPAFIVNDPPFTVPVHLALTSADQFQIKSAKVAGVEGTVTWKKWSGEAEDPELNDPKRMRNGYVFEITVTGGLPPGRANATLTIETDHPVFGAIRRAVGFQKGIVAFPDILYLGEMRNVPRKVFLVVNRPGNPFRITSAKVNISGFSVTVPVGEKDEHRLVVAYDGKHEDGSFEGVITLTTTDEKQPQILVPISGVIR